MMDDREFRQLDIISRIAPTSARWPITEHLHWAHLKTVIEEARTRLSKYYEQVDQIEADPRLSRQGKAEEKRKAAAKALAAFEKSPALRRAQESVASLQAKSEAKVRATIKPAANEAEAALHGEIRKHVASLKDERERLSFLEKNAGDPVLAAAVLEAPRFLTNLSDAEMALVKNKIEQAVIDPEIAQANIAVGKALRDAEHGWQRAQDLIAQHAGLSKSADGTWSQPPDTKAA